MSLLKAFDQIYSSSACKKASFIVKINWSFSNDLNITSSTPASVTVHGSQFTVLVNELYKA